MGWVGSRTVWGTVGDTDLLGGGLGDRGMRVDENGGGGSRVPARSLMDCGGGSDIEFRRDEVMVGGSRSWAIRG
jgi:hypothetical protein